MQKSIKSLAKILEKKKILIIEMMINSFMCQTRYTVEPQISFVCRLMAVADRSRCSGY